LKVALDHRNNQDGLHYDDDVDVDRAPICPSCGVTALPAHRSNVIDSHFVCDNDGCDAFGEPV
jgi:hypothetical protein